MKTIGLLVKDYKPLPFFSIIAVILMLISMILFLPVMIEYNMTGLVPRFPTLIVSGFAGMAALMVFTVGLILDTNGKKARQNFEIQMNILAAIYNQNNSADNRDH